MNDFKEKSKDVVAYLLICEDIKFQGTRPEGDVLYFIFTPTDKAQHYADQFLAKQTEPIQPKDYAEAQQTVTDLIWRWRKSRDVNGGNYGNNR